MLGLLQSSEAKIFCKETHSILPTSGKTPPEHVQEGFCAREQSCSMGLGVDELGAEGNLSTGWAFTHQGVQHLSWVLKDGSIDSPKHSDGTVQVQPGAAQKTRVHGGSKVQPGRRQS